MNKDMIKGFILGACTLALFASVGTAFASGKLTSINVVKGGIKLYVDGKLVKPTDSDGKEVEPFIYEGTTYLPLRALSNALTNYQKPVTWDSDTSTIYVGQAPVAAQTDITELEPYSRNAHVYKGSDEQASFQILDKKFTPFNRLEGSKHPDGVVSWVSDKARYTYMLKSNYSQLYAQYVIPYTTLGDTSKGTVSFYNVNKKGEETLIKEFTATAGDDPIQVSVNITGVEILKIEIDNGAFYNVTLAGIQ